MRGERIKEEIVSKSLENKKRAPNKWVVVREVVIIPDQLSRKCRRVDEKGDEQQQQRATPVALQIAPEPRKEGRARRAKISSVIGEESTDRLLTHCLPLPRRAGMAGI